MIVPLYRLGMEQLNDELKIGAYILVFFNKDGFFWEGRQSSYYRIEKKLAEERNKVGEDRITRERDANHWLYIILIIICALLSIYKVLSAEYSNIELIVRLCVTIVLSIASSVLIFFFKKKYSYNRKKISVKIWSEVKKEEERIKEQQEEQPEVS